MDVHVLPVDWLTHQDTLRAIRGEVFIEEQGVPREIEWDGQDEISHHFMAINEAGQRVGCGRLLPTGQIGRMAVLASHRNQGIGRLILDAAVAAAADLGFRRVFLHAQTAATEFYRRAGFLAEGEEFEEAGIPHLPMALELPIPFESQGEVAQPEIREEPAPAAADETALRQFNGESECIAGLIEALSWPQRMIRIYSQELDHTLFDRTAVVEALSEFVRRGPPARLHILIHGNSSLISRGHRLIELARRLDSKIEIRCVPAELAEDRHSCVISDEQGYFLMPDHTELQVLANAYYPVQASRLAERFEYLWNRSETDPEFRVLRL